MKLNKVKVFLCIFVICLIIIGIIFLKQTINNKNPHESSQEKDEIIEKDIIPPKIELNGNSEESLVCGEKYIEKGAVATDDKDGDITTNIKTKSNLDTNIAGEYEIKYCVSDSSGNKSEKVRKIKVYNELSKEGLPVLMYHFFYDKNERKAPDGNWIEINDFEEQIKYLSENNYYFPTWDEVEKYIDGTKKLPEKSIVLTVDDGDASFFDLAVPILQKYNVTATSFVITEWYGWRAENKEKNVNYQSHSNNMHQAGAGGKGVLLSWSKDKIIQDAKTSSEILGGATVFCYPFGQYNDESKKEIKESGYKLAFTTNSGRVKPKMVKFELPRVRIDGKTSMKEFINKIK